MPFGDPIAEGGDGHALVSAPHDLVSGGRVMLAVLVAAEEGDEQHRTGEGVGCRQAGIGSVVGEEPQLGVTFGDFTPEQRHEHETPRDDGLDGEGALKPLGAVKAEMLGAVKAEMLGAVKAEMLGAVKAEMLGAASRFEHINATMAQGADRAASFAEVGGFFAGLYTMSQVDRYRKRADPVIAILEQAEKKWSWVDTVRQKIGL